MSEPEGISPMVIELLQRVQDTRVFLRMAAVELRRIAERAPDIEAELLHVAQKLEAELEDLPEMPSDPSRRPATDTGGRGSCSTLSK